MGRACSPTRQQADTVAATNGPVLAERGILGACLVYNVQRLVKWVSWWARGQEGAKGALQPGVCLRQTDAARTIVFDGVGWGSRGSKWQE